MAGTPIGRILLMPRGDYSGIAVYNALDWVRHAGAAWVCTTDNTTGIAPAIGVPEWQLLAADGSVGGWTTLANKPFETIGKGLTVPTSGAEQDQLKINVDTTMLLGSKLGVNVQNTYSSSDGNPISGVGVANAISGKADSSDLDEWAATSSVSSSQITFTGVDDTSNSGYEVFIQVTDSSANKNPTVKLSTLSGAGTTSMSVSYSTDADNNAVAKLRRLK